MRGHSNPRFQNLEVVRMLCESRQRWGGRRERERGQRCPEGRERCSRKNDKESLSWTFLVHPLQLCLCLHSKAVSEPQDRRHVNTWEKEGNREKVN